MKRKLLIGMLVILSLMGPGQGRLPQVNDTVGISVGGGYASQVFVGNITEITDNFISLQVNASVVEFANGQEGQFTTYNPPKDICIGIGNIASIVWE
mgnify:FL=1